MNKQIKELRNKLKSSNIKIFDEFFLDDKKDVYMFLVQDLIITYNYRNKFVELTFHVDASPDYAAIVILNLMEIKNIKLRIMGVFTYNDKGDLITGEEAYNVVEEIKAKKAVKDYLFQQQCIHLLNNSKCYEV